MPNLNLLGQIYDLITRSEAEQQQAAAPAAPPATTEQAPAAAAAPPAPQVLQTLTAASDGGAGTLVQNPPAPQSPVNVHITNPAPAEQQAPAPAAPVMDPALAAALAQFLAQQQAAAQPAAESPAVTPVSASTGAPATPPPAPVQPIQPVQVQHSVAPMDPWSWLETATTKEINAKWNEDGGRSITEMLKTSDISNLRAGIPQG